METRKKTIRNSFLYLLPVAVASLFPLLSLPIFTRILTTEDYGHLALAQIYALPASGLVNLGLNLAYERNFFQYRGKEEAARLLYSILLFSIIALGCGITLTWLFKPQLAEWIMGSRLHADLLFWAFCATGTATLKTHYLTYFKNSEKAGDFTRYTIAESGLWFLFSFLMVVYLRVGVTGLVWSQLLSGIIIFFVLGWKFFRLLPISFNKTMLRESLKISLPLTPRLFLGIVNNQFDKYMIGLMGTIGGVGVYNIGQKIASTVFTFMTAVENVFTPRFYRKMFDPGEKGGESIGRYITPFAFVCLGPALLVSLFSEEMITLLTPPAYHGAIRIVIVLSMYYGFLFFGKLTGPRFLFTKKTYMTTLLSFVTTGLTIALNIPFIMKWGAIGAAWALLASGIISGTISLLVAQRYYPIRWEYGKMAAIFLIFFAASFAALILNVTSAEYPVRVTLKTALAGIYVYLGVQLRVITVENFNLLRGLLPGKLNWAGDHGSRSL